MKDIVAQVKENIVEHNLIMPGDKILVAFSGGPDSTALLYILDRLKKELKIELAACYINHRIRPKAVKKEIRFCHDFCIKLKILFVLCEADIPKYATEQKLSIEEAGRNFRLEVLEKIARDEKCDKIAMGHHLDDAIETILFRLFRGTGPGGLMPMKPIYGKFIRPLYNIPKSDIEFFLNRKKIRFMLDRSNLKSDFSRNYIRNKIIPVIEKHFGPKYRNSINNFARIISDDDSFLRGFAERQVEKICTITPGGKIIVDLPKIAVYAVGVRRRIIKLLLEKLSGRPGTGSFEQVERINDMIDGHLKAVDLGGSLRAISYGELLVLAAGKINIKRRNLEIPATTELPEIRTAIKTRLRKGNKAVLDIQKSNRKINLDIDKILQPVIVRSIRPGDKFRPLGLDGTKKIGDFLTDRKIARYLRDEIPVIEDKNGIIWLAGLEISENVKIDKKTKKVLEIELIRRKNTEGST